MKAYEVEAFIYGKKIGTLLLKEGIVYFEYDGEFRVSGLEISPLKLPLASGGVYTNTDDRCFEGLAGVFHDTLPDRFGTRVIERYFESKQVSAHELNVLQKLMFVGDKSIGAITYKPVAHRFDERAAEVLVELSAFYENAKKIVSGDAVEAVDEMLTFMDSAASAGGARAKAIVGYDPRTQAMTSGVKRELKAGFEHYLIKFDMAREDGRSSDYTKLEYLYMSMANEVGIEVPRIELLEHGSLSHYLIRRFDRDGAEPLHLHSAAGLTHSNFNLPMHFSYDGLFKLTRYLTGSQSAVNEQFRRMVFNLVGRNQDDHAKNFAFLMDRTGTWSLSPAYDITYANGTGYTRNHQLALLGKTDGFEREDLLEIARRHSIRPNMAKEIIEEVTEKFGEFEARSKALEIDARTIQRIQKELRTGLA